MDRKRLLAPDLALLGSLVTLLYCLLVFNGPAKLFRDADAGWHIRNGEAVLAGRTLPRADPYSFTRNGREWFAWEWGADVLMGAAHRWDGLSGVALVYSLAIAVCTWLWFRLTWAAGGDFLLSCVLASPMLSTVNVHWLARPHVFGWIFLLAWLCWLERPATRFRARDAAAVAGLACLWANVHASFFLLPALALLYAVAWRVRPAVWPTVAQEDRARARWYLLAAACAAPATLVTPYGFRLHAHLWQYLTDSELLSRVGEFQSYNFHTAGAFQILVSLGLAAFGGTLALARRRPDHFLLTALLLFVALRSARGLPIVALALLPLANGAIADVLREAGGFRPPVSDRLRSLMQYSANLRAIESGFRGYAWAPVVALAAYLLLHVPAVAARTGFSPAEFPIAASAEIEKLPSDARLLAPDHYGGYLIYRFDGLRPVFFDGRSDFYGAAFLKDYIRLVQVRPGWQELLERYRLTHALLPLDYSLVPALRQTGWKQRYRDEICIILERP